MANSVLQNKFSFWPLGNIVVAAAGTPVRITNLVDSAGVNNPNTVQGPTGSGNINQALPALAFGYPPTCQQLVFQAFKAGASHGLQANTGNVYICLAGDGTGSANRDDLGCILVVLTPGQTFTLAAAALNMNTISPYIFLVDADNSGDACQVSMLGQ